MSVKQAEAVAKIIKDAGGKIIGRTKLQKIGYLLEVANLGSGFDFEYKHYGPFSQELATGAQIAILFGLMKEEQRNASWGGTYSEYTSDTNGYSQENHNRKRLVLAAAAADSIELELAATALFLSLEKYPDPWQETARRKPEKAEGRIANAKVFYEKLREMAPEGGFPLLRG
jgi:uncharacterized protein